MDICAEVFPNQINNIENKCTNLGTPLHKVWCSLQQVKRNFPFLTGMMQKVPASNLTYNDHETMKVWVEINLRPQGMYAFLLDDMFGVNADSTNTCKKNSVSDIMKIREAV